MNRINLPWGQFVPPGILGRHPLLTTGALSARPPDVSVVDVVVIRHLNRRS